MKRRYWLLALIGATLGAALLWLQLPSDRNTATLMADRQAKTAVYQTSETTGTEGSFVKPSQEELKARLTKMQYAVTQEDATERPFKNTYWDNKKPGI